MSASGFGTVQVGRLQLREALNAASTSSDGKLSISGQEAAPVLSIADVAAVQDDLMSMDGGFLPVTFTDKADRNAYYQVTGTSATLMNWGGEVVTCDWTISLNRVGSDGEVDVESRMADIVTRTNTRGVVGERWHAPPIGHSAYWSADTTPSTMTRASADGAMTIYRGVPAGVHPRFACPLDAYQAGRVRFFDDLGRERSGSRFTINAVGWELNNALLRVRWDAIGLKVASWDAASSGWETKSYLVTVAGETLRTPDHATLVRNDYECVILRLLWSRAVAGRTSVDVTLRRGARLVEGYIQSSPAATITVGLEIAEATTAGNGYITASSDDIAGNRYMVASVGAFSANTTASKLSVTSAANMDFAVGQVVGGASAAPGDTAPILYQQLLGAPPETVQAVRR